MTDNNIIMGRWRLLSKSNYNLDCEFCPSKWFYHETGESRNPGKTVDVMVDHIKQGHPDIVTLVTLGDMTGRVMGAGTDPAYWGSPITFAVKL